MQVSVEATSKLERRVTVTIPVEKLEEAFEQQIAKISKTANVKGFRPGKVPMSYIKQNYSQTARQEALSEVIQSSLYAAIDQEKLQPVSVPTVEPKTVLPGQPIEFIATFEVVPDVGTVRFEAKSLEKQMATITEADIDKVLDHLRQQHAIWKKVTRPAQEKDQVVIDFRGSIDGKTFAGGEAHDYPIIIGSKTMIPGFEEGLVGLNVNDEKVIHVKFPDNYFAKEYADKAAEFAVKVMSVSEPEFPELNDEFTKKLGVKSGNANDLRGEIRKNLERELERVIKAKLKNQIFDKLLEQNPLEIPNALVEREAKRVHDEVHPHHGQEHKHTEAEMTVFNEAAKRNVALGLLIAELIKQYKIVPNKERTQTAIANIASAYEKPNEIINWYSSNKRGMAEIEMQILEEEVVEKLLEGVQIKEKMLSYNELISDAHGQLTK